MKVQGLSLRDFRNFSGCEIQPGPHLNFFVGPNAQGKTSILEALHMVSHLQSFRNAKPGDTIRSERVSNHVTADLFLDHEGEVWRTRHELKYSWADADKGKVAKTAVIDGKAVSGATQYLLKRRLQTIAFNPSDHELVQGDPKVRRSYLNQSVSSESASYLTALKKFNQVLAQRNEALKSDRRDLSAWIETFTPIYVETAAQVSLERLLWLKRLQGIINSNVSAIAPRQPPLSLRYLTRSLSIERLEFEKLDLRWSLSDIQNELAEQLKKTAASERIQRVSLVGPHRDDWWFEMSGKPLKNQGSQGEIRSALLALKLSEIRLFLDATRVKPVILLDDFSSELDFERREFLLRHLHELNLQTFVTTTENLEWLGTRFEVLSGTVIEKN